MSTAESASEPLDPAVAEVVDTGEEARPIATNAAEHLPHPLDGHGGPGGPLGLHVGDGERHRRYRGAKVKMTNISAFCLWAYEQRAALKAMNSPLYHEPSRMAMWMQESTIGSVRSLVHV